MAAVTPPIGSQGLFILREPFVTNSKLTYRVAAIRSFEELVSRGIDPVELVYTPVGLSSVEYRNDAQNKALIITLMSDTEKPIYVPNTYIDAYPDMAVVPHSHMVLTCSLGVLPDTYDTTRIQQAVKQAVSDDTGVEPTVFIAVAPLTEAITQTQYIQNLNVRQAAIKNRQTTYSKLLAAQSEIADLKQSEKSLLEIIDQLQERIVELEGKAPK